MPVRDGAGGAQNPPALPDTRPGQLMAQWLTLRDAADLALMKKWGEENLNERTLQRVGAERFARQTSADCGALDSPYTVVVLANQDPPAAGILGSWAKAIAAQLARK